MVQRILHIIGRTCGGGVESVVMNYYLHINREEIQFDFVVEGKPSVSFCETVERLGGRIYSVTPYTRNLFKYMYDIYRIIKKKHYKIVHSHMNSMGAFSLFPAYIAHAPYRIIHNHSTAHKSEGVRYIIKELLKNTAMWFANNYFACSKMAAYWMYGGMKYKSSAIRIIDNAIDCEKYAYDEDIRKQLKQRFNLEDKKIIGFIGRLERQKNPLFLIYLMKELIKVDSNIHLVVAGDGSLRSKVVNLIKELEINDNITLLGIYPRAYELYNIMDIFVLPSYFEGLPVVSIEAQANGLPIITSLYITEEAKIIKKNFFQYPLDILLGKDEKL